MVAETFEKAVELDLQKVINRRWAKFMTSPRSAKLKKFLEKWLLPHGFDKLGWNKHVANPAYDNAAWEMIGKPFQKTLYDYDLFIVDTRFPGDFQKSKELPVGAYEARRFKMKLYMKDLGPMFEATLTFTHLHGKFGFPEAPSVSIRRA